jgi:hypothetical protein
VHLRVRWPGRTSPLRGTDLLIFRHHDFGLACICTLTPHAESDMLKMVSAETSTEPETPSLDSEPDRSTPGTLPLTLQSSTFVTEPSRIIYKVAPNSLMKMGPDIDSALLGTRSWSGLREFIM